MIHLFYKNKFGKNILTTEEETMVWRSFFKTSEDSLSSSVIGLLFYLPVEILWKLIKGASYHTPYFATPNKMLSFDFWPHWDNTSTKNENFIEPDIFIRFDTFDIVIEAKRYDFIEDQLLSQWKSEVQAYVNEYGDENKKMYFIALSGLKDMWQQQSPIVIGNQKFEVIVLGWKKLLNSINSEIEQLTVREDNSKNHILMILNDVVKAFEIHGFYTGCMLNSFPKTYRLGNMSFKGNKISKYFLTKQIPLNLRNINLHINSIKKWQLLPNQN